ncbi:hypothetical protein HWV62_12988 [Athelia sp. TMB]|nr:hypothetical protein HWV62_12988 [Athelia sp. TMB]
MGVLRSLGGKTIVIDGTLITQRLHFASIPWTHRHVLGWYKILQELRESDVDAICVFDGQERNQAKARENARRKEIRKQTQARGSLEADRLKRLRSLVDMVEQIRSFNPEEQEHTISSLRALVSGPPGISAPLDTETAKELLRKLSGTISASPDASEAFLIEHQSLSRDREDIGELYMDNTSSGQDENLVGAPQVPEDSLTSISHPSEDAEQHEAAVSSKTPSSREDLLERLISDEELDVLFVQLQATSLVSSEDVIMADEPDDVHEAPATGPGGQIITSAPSMISAKDIPSALATLYDEYRQSIPKIASLGPSTSSAPFIDSTTTTELDTTDDQSEYAMSKHQLRLTLDEGKVWDELVHRNVKGDLPRPPIFSPAFSDASEETVQDDLNSLEERSSQISQSYDKRSNPPTLETYEECKEIIKAMGVPCIESAGAHEAEALAAALVLNGYADYVASEDTDVLVYEAPLIRGITSRADGMVIVSGAEIRTTLDLNRDSFVDFVLLLGTDFSQRIKNVGPARALKFIREHGSIEKILEKEPKYPPRPPQKEYVEQVELARQVFMNLPPIPDSSELQQGEQNKELIAQILQQYGLHRAVKYEWEPNKALAGNYFQDDPRASF